MVLGRQASACLDAPKPVCVMILAIQCGVNFASGHLASTGLLKPLARCLYFPGVTIINKGFAGEEEGVGKSRGLKLVRIQVSNSSGTPRPG